MLDVQDLYAEVKSHALQNLVATVMSWASWIIQYGQDVDTCASVMLRKEVKLFSPTHHSMHAHVCPDADDENDAKELQSLCSLCTLIPQRGNEMSSMLDILLG